jgi:hypothetical protein
VVEGPVRLETRFARLGRDRIAYQTLGEGPLVLVVNAPGSFGHADVVFEDPAAMLYSGGWPPSPRSSTSTGEATSAPTQPPGDSLVPRLVGRR